MTPGVLVHEWIQQHGGSEKVFDRMVASFPEADLLCLWNDDPGRYGSRHVRETWLAKTPLRKSKMLALPAMIPTWRMLGSGEYDWALVSSHLFAHHATFRRSANGVRKFVYAHTPARYIWAPDFDRRGRSVAARAAIPFLKHVDRRRTSDTHAFAANSRFVQQRMRDSWGVEATVIYPPVEVELIQSVEDWRAGLSPDEQRIVDGLPDQFVLGASRFVPYKRLDLVIDAGESVGLPVVLAGRGPERASLEARAAEASVPVTFVDRPGDALLYALYQRASVFVFPAIEDFGIMPVEAMSCGTPVVVNVIGGAQESVSAPLAGALFDQFSVTSLANAVDAALGLDRAAIATHARSFSTARFDDAIQSWVG